MKKIYNYHPDTGGLIGTDYADVSPLEPGVFLIPANATAEVPPSCEDGQYAVFHNGVWSVVAEPQPTPEPQPTIDELRSTMWGRIKAERDRRRFEGGVKVGDHWYLSTAVAMSEYNSLTLLSTGRPDNTVLRSGWRTMDGAKVDMTAGLVRQILLAGFATVAANDDAAEAHKAALVACDDPALYDFSFGWPSIFSR